MKTFILSTLVSSQAFAAIDLLTQNLEVDLMTSPTELSVRSTVRIRTDAPTSSLRFLLPTGTIESVTVNGTPVRPVTDTAQYLLEVPLQTPLAANTEATVVVSLRGTPNCTTNGRIECMRADGFTFMASFGLNVRWYLVGYDSSDPFLGQLTLRIPGDHEAACVQGVDASKQLQSDTSQKWTFSWPIATDAIAFYASRATRIASPDGRHVGFYRDPGTRAVMETILTSSARYYPAMAALLGPLPGERFHYAFVPLNFFAGAQGHLNLVFLNEFMTTPQYAYIVPQVPHEMAHSWWGNLSVGATPFLTESMAEYTMWRVRGDLDGEQEGTGGRRMNAVWYMYTRPAEQDVALFDPNVTRSPVYVQVVYHKGPVVARTLEEWVGTERFSDGLKKAVEIRQLKADDFMKAIETASGGVDLTRFRSRWFETRGFPRIRVSPVTKKEGDEWSATLSLTASDDFVLKIPLVAHLPDGTLAKSDIALDGTTATWTKKFKSRPLALDVDPSWTAVRELVSDVFGDVTFDGEVDGADLIEMALHVGGALPTERRVDGSYDPLYDLNGDRKTTVVDVDLVLDRAQQ